MKKKLNGDRKFDALFDGLAPVIREYALKHRTKDCPDAGSVAAYINKVLPAAEMKALKKHILSCPHCAVGVLELQMTPAPIPRKTESSPKSWLIDFVKGAVRVISEPFTFYPAVLQPVIMRGGKREYKGAKISRIWKIASFDVRITAEKQKSGKIHFLIRVLKSKKPLANETVKLGRESKVTNRQGLAEFTVQASSRRSSITLSVPGLDQKVRIGIKSIK